MANPDRPRVVIVGAGFGGLWAARALARYPVEVILIDRNNYHTFFPLLYQVAAAELEPESIVYPVRSMLRRFSNVHFVLAEVEGLDLERRMLRTEAQEIPYDYFILAVGSTSHFFGVEGAAENAFPLKTLEEGIVLRNHILSLFEQAIYEPDAEKRRRRLTFAIVGGGPTGVEFAGALAELIRGPLVRDYPTLDFHEVRVVLLEALDGLLPGFPDGLRRYAQVRLHRMGVEVRVNALVTQITPEALYLRDGTVIPTETVVWTAGVRGDPRVHPNKSGLPTAKNGRVPVLPTLQVPGHPQVYVVGDLAFVEEEGRPLLMVAPVAIQQGVATAKNIGRQVAGLDPLPFRYQDRGMMVTIGRNAAVAHIRGLNFTGFLAWLTWLSVHLFNLIGFRNRLLVLINWSWDYFLYERAIRLILPAPRRSVQAREVVERRF